MKKIIAIAATASIIATFTACRGADVSESLFGKDSMPVAKELANYSFDYFAVFQYFDFASKTLVLPECDTGSVDTDEHFTGNEGKIVTGDKIFISYSNCRYDGVMVNGEVVLTFKSDIEESADFSDLTFEALYEFNEVSMVIDNSDPAQIVGDVHARLDFKTDDNYSVENKSSSLNVDFSGQKVSLSDFSFSRDKSNLDFSITYQLFNDLATGVYQGVFDLNEL